MARTLLTLSVSLALACGAVAQDPIKPEPKVEKQEPQKIEKPAELDRIDELKSQLARTRAELVATKAMVTRGGLPAQVLPGLGNRSLQATTLDLGVESIPQPAIAQPVETAKTGGVRLLGDGEKERLGADVVATVDGEPITKSEFEDVRAYYASRPNAGDETATKRSAMRALVIQKGALAHFHDRATPAREKMAEIERLLADGQDFAEVAKKYSQCPSAARGGDLGEFGYDMMDPMFEKAAFQTKVGERSGVIQSGFGYHIVKVTGHADGDAPKVHASHILVMFDADQQAVRKTLTDVMGGRVDLAFANDDWRALAPF